MSDVILNAELVEKMRKGRGVSLSWLIKHVGVGRTTGYHLFRSGFLPADPARRKVVVAKLAEYFGVEANTLLLRLPTQQRTA